MQHFGHAVSERHLLRLMLELERLHPLPPGMRPCAALVGSAQTATKQVFDQPVPGATLVSLRGCSLTYEIAKCLVLGRGNPDRREAPGDIGLSS